MRTLCILAILIPACTGDSGYHTGMATLSSSSKVKSASAVPFKGADAMGNMVLGWNIDFYSNGVGTDCEGDGLDKIASIGIFTNQAVGSAKFATLQTGDIPIVKDSPPSTVNGTAATMGVDDVSAVQGSMSITDVYLDHINGTVSAGGNDSTGTGIAITGMFMAPACGPT